MREWDDAGAPRSRESRSIASAFVVLTLAGLLALGRAEMAAAHARLLRSAPTAGEQLAVPPSTLDLWFSELLDEAFNGIELFTAAPGGHAGAPIQIGPPAVDPGDRTHVSARVAPLSPGRYVVHWRVLSRDGHPVRGRLEFIVADGANPGR